MGAGEFIDLWLPRHVTIPDLSAVQRGTACLAMFVFVVPRGLKWQWNQIGNCFWTSQIFFQVGAWRALEIMMGSEWVFYKRRPISSRHSKCSCCWNVRTAQIISALAMTGVHKVALFIRWWCSSSLVNKYRSARWNNHLPDVSCR